MGYPSCFSSCDLDMDGCRRWCITALATDSWSRLSLQLSAAEQLSQAMLEYSRHGRSIVLYSTNIVSTLTRARYPSFFRAAAFGAVLFNMLDTWSDHFSVEARVKPRWETVHTCCSLSPPRRRFLPVSQPCLPTTICSLLAELKVAFQSEDQVWTASILNCACRACDRMRLRYREVPKRNLRSHIREAKTPDWSKELGRRPRVYDK